MKVFLAALLGWLIAPSVWAATYVFTGANYSAVQNFTPPCGGGPCANYAATMHVAGSFSTATPLPPNQAQTDITASVMSYSFSDGINTISNTDSDGRIYRFMAGTDAAGNVSASTIILQRFVTGTTPHVSGDRYSHLDIFGSNFSTQAVNNVFCSVIGTAPSGATNTCTIAAPNLAETSVASSGSGTWIAGSSPPVVAPTPALDRFALALLVFLIGFAAYAARRRQAR